MGKKLVIEILPWELKRRPAPDYEVREWLDTLRKLSTPKEGAVIEKNEVGSH